jgi:hypothetical protein
MNDVLTPCHVCLLGCLLANGTALGVLSPIDDSKHLFALEDLFLQQRLRQAVQGLAMLGQDAACLFVGLRYQPLDLSIQALGRHLRVHTLVVFERLLVEVRTSIRQVIHQWTGLLAHAPLAHHTSCQLSSFLQVVLRACGNISQRKFL